MEWSGMKKFVCNTDNKCTISSTFRFSVFNYLYVFSRCSPKKALTEFFESLKAKKTLPKIGHVQHYHIHYYPMPFPLLAWTRAPDKYYLDELYEYVPIE